MKMSDSTPPSAGGQDPRREHERREAVIRADAIGPDSFGEPRHLFACSVVDISQGGVAILSRKVLAIGDTVYLRIEKLGGQTVYGVQVRNVRYREGHGHVFGCVWLPKSAWKPAISAFGQAKAS